MQVAWVIATCIGMPVAFFLGILAARVRVKQVEPPRPICECGDPRGFHKDGTGKCNGKVYRGHLVGYESCPCLHYTGPIPITEVWPVPMITQDPDREGP